MIKGGGYISARIRQPPTAQTIKKNLMWVRGVAVCRGTKTHNYLTIVAWLYCSAYLVLMSVGACLIECSFSLCFSFLILWQSSLRSARGLLVFVNSPHYSNEDHVELDFPISLSM